MPNMTAFENTILWMSKLNVLNFLNGRTLQETFFINVMFEAGRFKMSSRLKKKGSMRTEKFSR